MIGSVLYGDPLINQSGDTIDGVDMIYVTGVAGLMLASIASLVAG